MAEQVHDAPIHGGERILVIDDDPGLAEVVQLMLAREGYAVEREGTLEGGLRRVDAADFDLVVTDLKLPDGTGLDAIPAIRGLHEGLPIILMTSYSSMESAIAALRAGAVDYITKPFQNDEFVHAVERALNERRMSRENALLKRRLRAAHQARQVIGESAGVRRVLELVQKAGPSEASVLISGESGTGKERVALELHYSGLRADGPFVPVNCGAIAPAQLEAELFGQAGGTLAGAAPRTEGRIREAHGGTLFLDEVSELPPALQVKLLRALEEQSVRPVGGRQAYAVDVRFIAAAHRDLAEALADGRFRKDLYYKLSVISIPLPPLRERGAVILLLARHFVEQHARRLGRPVRGFDDDFAAFLQNYPWPGNVRELENLMERAVILGESEVLTDRDLAEVAPALPMVRASAPARGSRPLAIEEYIREVIERFQDSHSETELARMLGIGRKALWIRRRQWGLKRGRKTGA